MANLEAMKATARDCVMAVLASEHWAGIMQSALSVDIPKAPVLVFDQRQFWRIRTQKPGIVW